ncbi:MAG: hypothetical protein NTV16_10800 [Actinobacteria bacterium]|nr:hypothetical protein [Actinomycetota bacterium]
MKRNKVRLLIIIIIISIFFAFSVPGCMKAEPVSIENIILAASVDANGNPTAETSDFKEGTKEIYLVIKVKNMQKTDNISVKWTYLDKGLEIDSKSFTPEGKFTGNHVFKFKVTQGFTFGNYEVRTFLNGTQIKTVSFKVN